MATLNSIYAEIKNMETAIIAKGGEVTKANSSPSLSDIVAGINSINTQPKAIIYNTTAPKVVITAELPNMTINLKTAEGDIVDTKTTGSEGGRVELNTIDPGVYIVEAFNLDNEKIWDNEVEVLADKNTYYVKTGKKFNDYTWPEIKQAADGNYAKYMWRESDRKVLKEWMGCDLSNCPNDADPSTSRHFVYIVSFDHDTKVKDGKKAGITLALYTYNAGYETQYGFYSSTVTSNKFVNKSNAQSGAAGRYSLISGIYQTSNTYIGNYWAHVYEAQHNPDTTNTYEWFIDGSVLNDAYLALPMLGYYGNGGRASYTSTSYKESTTHPSILYWRDWLFNGIKHSDHATIGKLYPDLDLCYYGNTEYYDSVTRSDGTSYHRDYNTTGWRMNWLTGLPRLFTLSKGEQMYIKSKEKITASTVGTYYLFDYTTKSYQAVNLPSEYDSTKNNLYFEKYTLTDDGPILKCFPQELKDIMEKVVKVTVAPYLDSNANLIESPLTIETEDYLYLPSAYELYGDVFGNKYDLYQDTTLPGTYYQYPRYYKLEGEKPFITAYDPKINLPLTNSTASHCGHLTRTNRYWGYITKSAENVITAKSARYNSENIDQPRLYICQFSGNGRTDFGSSKPGTWYTYTTVTQNGKSRSFYLPYELSPLYNGTSSNSANYQTGNYYNYYNGGIVSNVDNYSCRVLSNTNTNAYVRPILSLMYCFAI